MAKTLSALSRPMAAIFENPAELLVTKANLYGAAAPGAAPPSPDFLHPANPTLAAIAANASVKSKPVRAALRVIIVVISPSIPGRELFYHFRPEASAAFQASSTRMLPSVSAQVMAGQAG